MTSGAQLAGEALSSYSTLNLRCEAAFLYSLRFPTQLRASSSLASRYGGPFCCLAIRDSDGYLFRVRFDELRTWCGYLNNPKNPWDFHYVLPLSKSIHANSYGCFYQTFVALQSSIYSISPLLVAPLSVFITLRSYQQISRQFFYNTIAQHISDSLPLLLHFITLRV